jgi:hypothetical protein
MRAEPSPGSRTPSWLDSGEIVRHAKRYGALLLLVQSAFTLSLRAQETDGTLTLSPPPQQAPQPCGCQDLDRIGFRIEEDAIMINSVNSQLQSANLLIGGCRDTKAPVRKTRPPWSAARPGNFERPDTRLRPPRGE